MFTLDEREAPLKKLLLDPNNFRFQDDPEFVFAEPKRFHEPAVQERAFRRLRTEGLLELKHSILANGFLPVERIVVREYGDADALLVVEGNRRVAALRWIQDDHDAGVEVPDNVVRMLDAVPVTVIAAPSGEEEAAVLAIMGVRHVGGIRQWGGYQRAKLVTELRDTHTLESADIAARLAMTTHEVNRRYRAFKALRQMEQDEEYGDRATPQMYPLFHEAVSLPAVRSWLDWREAESRFAAIDDLQQFYDLITAHEEDDGTTVDPKITTYSQVRELRAILAVPEAKRVLLDPSRTFSEAGAIAKAEELSRSWATQVAEAVAALSSIGALELRSLSRDDLAEIERLTEVAHAILSAHAKLTA